MKANNNTFMPCRPWRDPDVDRVLGELGPSVKLLENRYGIELVVELLAEHSWLDLSNHPLPKGFPVASVPVRLAFDAASASPGVALYVPTLESSSEMWAKENPDLLRPPGAGATNLTLELWQRGWTCWARASATDGGPTPLAQLLRAFDERNRSMVPGGSMSQLTDLERVNSGLEDAVTPVEPPSAQAIADGLADTVFGQEKALQAMAQEVSLHLGRVEPTRPGGLFFVGPTGVGKTRSAEALAGVLNGLQRKDAPVWRSVRLDMAEYQEAHRVSSLLGAPPGYVGYGEKSLLMEALAKDSHCVIVFDEIEKSHPDIIKALMGAMEDGRLSSPSPLGDQGHQLDCRNAIFIFTSNLDAQGMVSEVKAGLDPMAIEAACRSRLLQAGIKPEIVNRVGRCVVFLPIPDSQRIHVALAAVLETGREFGLEVKHVCPELMLDVLKRNQNGVFGARAERRTVGWLFGEAMLEARRQGLKAVRILSSPTRCVAA